MAVRLRLNAVNFAVDSVVLRVLHNSSELLGDIISGSFALTVVMIVSWMGMGLVSFYRGSDVYIDIVVGDSVALYFLGCCHGVEGIFLL